MDVHSQLEYAVFRLGNFASDRLEGATVAEVSGPDFQQARDEILTDDTYHRAGVWALDKCPDEFRTPHEESALGDIPENLSRRFRTEIDRTKGHRLPRKLKNRIRKTAAKDMITTLTGLNQLQLGLLNASPNPHLIVGTGLIRGVDFKTRA